jgi:hypothetical protein
MATFETKSIVADKLRATVDELTTNLKERQDWLSCCQGGEKRPKFSKKYTCRYMPSMLKKDEKDEKRISTREKKDIYADLPSQVLLDIEKVRKDTATAIKNERARLDKLFNLQLTTNPLFRNISTEYLNIAKEDHALSCNNYEKRAYIEMENTIQKLIIDSQVFNELEKAERREKLQEQRKNKPTTTTTVKRTRTIRTDKTTKTNIKSDNEASNKDDKISDIDLKFREKQKQFDKELFEERKMLSDKFETYVESLKQRGYNAEQIEFCRLDNEKSIDKAISTKSKAFDADIARKKRIYKAKLALDDINADKNKIKELNIKIDKYNEHIESCKTQSKPTVDWKRTIRDIDSIYTNGSLEWDDFVVAVCKYWTFLADPEKKTKFDELVNLYAILTLIEKDNSHSQIDEEIEYLKNKRNELYIKIKDSDAQIKAISKPKIKTKVKSEEAKTSKNAENFTDKLKALISTETINSHHTDTNVASKIIKKPYTFDSLFSVKPTKINKNEAKIVTNSVITSTTTAFTNNDSLASVPEKNNVVSGAVPKKITIDSLFSSHVPKKVSLESSKNIPIPSISMFLPKLAKTAVEIPNKTFEPSKTVETPNINMFLPESTNYGSTKISFESSKSAEIPSASMFLPTSTKTMSSNISTKTTPFESSKSAQVPPISMFLPNFTNITNEHSNKMKLETSKSIPITSISVSLPHFTNTNTDTDNSNDNTSKEYETDSEDYETISEDGTISEDYETNENIITPIHSMYIPDYVKKLIVKGTINDSILPLDKIGDILTSPIDINQNVGFPGENIKNIPTFHKPTNNNMITLKSAKSAPVLKTVENIIIHKINEDDVITRQTIEHMFNIIPRRKKTTTTNKTMKDKVSSGTRRITKNTKIIDDDDEPLKTSDGTVIPSKTTRNTSISQKFYEKMKVSRKSTENTSNTIKTSTGRLIPPKSADDAVVSRKSDEDQVILHKSTEDKLVPRKSTEDKLVPPKFSEDKLVPRKSTEDKLIPRKSTEDKLVPHKSTEDKLVSRKSTEDKLVSPKSSEDKLVPRKSTEDKLVPRKFTEDKLVPPKSTEDKLFPRKFTEDKLVPPKSTEDKLFPRKSTEDKLVSRKSIDDILSPKFSNNMVVSCESAEDKVISHESTHEKLISNKSTEDILPKKFSDDKVVSSKSAEDKIVPHKFTEKVILPQHTSDNTPVNNNPNYIANSQKITQNKKSTAPNLSQAPLINTQINRIYNKVPNFIPNFIPNFVPNFIPSTLNKRTQPETDVIIKDNEESERPRFIPIPEKFHKMILERREDIEKLKTLDDSQLTSHVFKKKLCFDIKDESKKKESKSKHKGHKHKKHKRDSMEMKPDKNIEV